MSVENKRVWLPGKGDKVVLRFWILDNRQNLDFGFEILVLDLRFERRMSRERISGCLAPGKGGQSGFEMAPHSKLPVDETRATGSLENPNECSSTLESCTPS